LTQNQRDFVNFMLEEGALKFGDFTLKSGRKSPFFMNMGTFNEGKQLYKLGHYYAAAIYDAYGTDFNVLFGPSYKGIPLAVATAMILSNNYGLNVCYCSNRKEIKDHGDSGILLGRKLKDGDKVVMIEDVTTSGKSMDETVPIVRAQADIEIVGLMVSLNRHEASVEGGTTTALEDVASKYGFPTGAIVSMPEVISYMQERELLNSEQILAIEKYYAQYGPKKKEGNA